MEKTDFYWMRKVMKMEKLETGWTCWIENRNCQPKGEKEKRKIYSEKGLSEREIDFLISYMYYYELEANCKFETVEEFWGVMNFICPEGQANLGKMKSQNSIWICKNFSENRLLPVTLDLGYCVTFRISKELNIWLDKLFTDLMMAAIGEQIDVLGIGVMEKPSDMIFKIWAESDPQKVLDGIVKVVNDLQFSNVKTEFEQTIHWC